LSRANLNLNGGIRPVQANDPNEFDLRLAFVSLSAKGKVALYLVVPVGVLLIALAWRIAFG
jgi:hypothetical protein